MCFLGLPSFRAFVPLSNLIIIPWPYLLLCNKPIMDKLQREGNFPHCLITLPLSLQAVRDIFQVCPWIFLNCSNTHLLGHKIIRDMSQHAWVAGHCLVAHFLRLILIWDITYCVWFYIHCLVAQLLGLEMVKHTPMKVVLFSLLQCISPMF